VGAEPDLEGLLAAGGAALEAGDWTAARAAFAAVLEVEEIAEALLGLSDAAWWLGESELSVRTGERAYGLLRRRPDPATAAFTAIGLYFVHRVSLGNVAVSRGWLGRAAALVEEFGLEPLEGWVLLMRAHDAPDEAAREARSREALARGRGGADPDLELCALSELGTALVGQGRVEEGIALLDQAMAGSLAGECGRLDTVVYAACSMIAACTQLAEVRRAAEWIRAADDFSRRYGALHLHTLCRTAYGGLLLAVGRWDEAEAELQAALRSGKGAERALYGEALAGLAALRLAQGRAEEAAELLAGFEDDTAAAPVIAELQLAAGHPAVAATLLRRRLRDGADDEPGIVVSHHSGAAPALERAALRELLVDAELARGDAVAAAAEASALAEAGARLGWEVVSARAERALGRVLVATGDLGGATACLDRALVAFARLELPLEAGRTRLSLAACLAASDRESAAHEARAALAAFDRLGARADADRAAALLRELGDRGGRAAPRAAGGLTKRELEVLRLLGEGLSNRQIADRLYLAVKTVEHHVRGVFTKLGVTSRAAAAAYAARHLARDSAAD
jgi:DNA-binding NarL/FixJ family response regulator